MDEKNELDNSFSVALSQVRAGKCVSNASAKLSELLEAVEDTGRDGTLTLKLSVKHSADGEVLILDSTTIKKPQPAADPTFFYVNDKHRLTRDDPRGQKDIFRKEGEVDPTENHNQNGIEAKA